MDLESAWFGVLLALMVGYAILDGFDLGVGGLHLFARGDEERRIFLNSIGPVWDGNEVWLVTLGGALFAGFPEAYATLFSAFYTPFMLLLFALIFRAVSIEFRSKNESPLWRKTWDVAFSVSSLILMFAFGLALGNLVQGLPLDSEGSFEGGFLTFVTPYSVLTGLCAVSFWLMHGGIYLMMKTEGALQKRIEGWLWPLMGTFIVTYSLHGAATLWLFPELTKQVLHRPYLLVLILGIVLSCANIPRLVHKQRTGWAFVNSSLAIGLMLGVYGLSVFPEIVFSTTSSYNLTIYNAASSPSTLKSLLWIAGLGVPLVGAYTISIYRVFRGPVVIDKTSY